jgi:hypothetical protein
MTRCGDAPSRPVTSGSASHTRNCSAIRGIDTSLTASNVVLPLRLEVAGAELAFFAISATVETAGDVTVDDLRIETFYPTDQATAERIHHRSGCPSPGLPAPSGEGGRGSL